MLNKNRVINIIIEIICCLYAILFIYAAVSKILDFEVFQVQLRQSPLLSSFANWVSWSLLLLEIGIATILLIPKSRYIALYSALSLMSMFSIYIFIILNYSEFIPCSCGGILEKMNWEEHLVFNISFVLLAIIAIIISKSTKNKLKTLLYITIIIITSSSSIIVLYIISENNIHYNNNFTRRFRQHPIKWINQIDLEVNSYYFAGVDNNKIYLANSSTPALMTIIDSNLNTIEKKEIHLVNTNLSFRSIQIKVKPPYFYVIDGTVSCVFKGKISDWKANPIFIEKKYFDLPLIIDSTQLVFRKIDTQTNTNVLGTKSLTSSNLSKLNDSLLQKQIDGIFDTDGTIQYSDKLNKIVYTYYYRNQYIITDKNLNLIKRGQTIDTTKTAKILIKEIKKYKEKKLDAPPKMVNKATALYNNLLFINSSLPGKHESKSMWKKAAIVDVYNINNNSYLFSTYINNIQNKKMRSFIVTNTNLYALIGDHLVKYQLMNNLKKDFNSK